MKSLDSLKNLIFKLTSDELKSLVRYLEYYSEKDSIKSVELLQLILKKPSAKSGEIEKMLYSIPNKTAFNKLIGRLNDKILEILLFNSNLNKDHYSSRLKVLIDLKKKLIQSDILSLKGLREEADKICRKVISKAEKYEVYDLVLQGLLVRQKFVNVRKQRSLYQRLKNQIEYAEIKQKSNIESEILYNDITNQITNSSDTSKYFIR